MTTQPTYWTIHQWLRKQRGPAYDYPCARCGDTACEWALTGEPRWLDPRPYTDDLDAYSPMCASCHRALDNGWPFCPHGPARDRRPGGACLACSRERDRARYKERYANDPEFRAREVERSRIRYLKRIGQLDNGSSDAVE